MFVPYNNGTVENINGIDINIPPVGWVPDWYTGTGELIESPILFQEFEKSEQYWRRPFDIRQYDVARKKEKSIQATNAKYLDDSLEMMRRVEWQRRLNGIWMMINGEPVYITGLHYFYMTYWKLDDGYPSYRITDREFFLFWQYCVEDDDCMGMVEATKRRQGKTYRSGAVLFEPISRTKNKVGGIQSKNDTDAQINVYRNAVINPFKFVPDFFKPIYDEDKGANPKGELAFNKTFRKGDSVLDSAEEELNSVINYGSAKTHEYDGKKLYRYIGDECGKVKDIDVYERHRVVRFCLLVDDRIIGKALYTTTVEDRKYGGENFEVLWKASDQKNKINGRTESGLYKYFLPAHRAMNYDKYGVPDEKKNMDIIIATRKQLENNAKELAAEMRRNPLSENELFMTDSTKCPFNVLVLTDTLNYCRNLPGDSTELAIRGDLVWATKDVKAIWVPNNINGKWMMSYIPPEAHQNNVYDNGRDENRYEPLNDIRFTIGCDPVSHGIEAEHGGSNAAAVVFRKLDINHRPELSDNFTADYLFDPDDPEEFYEDMIIACFFFGCKIHIEKQKFDIFNHFKKRGYRKFVMDRPENTLGSDKVKQNFIDSPGTPASTSMIEFYIDRLKFHWAKKGRYCRLPRLLEDSLRFTYVTRTKHDLTVASGYAVVGAEAPIDVKADPIPISKFFDMAGRGGY